VGPDGRGTAPTARQARAAALVLAGAVVAGCGGGGATPTASPTATSGSASPTPTAAPTVAAAAVQWAWSKVADAPLGPWLQVVTLWTGGEIVVLTGDTACPPRTQCPPSKVKAERGGAAYDPQRDAWRELAAPPFSLYLASAAVVGRTVFVLAPANNDERLPEFYAYSLDEMGWRRLPDPPIGPNSGVPTAITGVGDRLVAWDRFPTRHDPTDLGFNPATDEWTTMPADPGGRGQERTLLGLPDGRAVSVAAPLPPPLDPTGVRPPRFWRAAVLDAEGREWRSLPPSGIAVSPISSLGHGRWFLAGGRIVNPEVGTVASAASGVVAPTAGSPLPTGGVLDPDTGAWETLPERPARQEDLRRAADPWDWASAAGGDYAVLRGWIYDVPRRAWSRVPPVPDAPGGLTDPAVAWVNDRMYAWGGAAGAGPTAPGRVLRVR
jgi:hypothetical protein